MVTTMKRATKPSKYAEGTIHQTHCGPIEVLRFYPRTDKRSPRADIRYLETGTLQNVQVGNIPGNKIWDCRKPSVYGVGYLDSYVSVPKRGCNSTYRRAYDLWCNMLKRAYHPSQERYYGDVEVDVRWHSFKNFWNSLEELPGYEDWVNQKYPRMSLDKDIRCPGSRVYSKETCSFVSHAENSRAACKKRRDTELKRLGIEQTA